MVAIRKQIAGVLLCANKDLTATSPQPSPREREDDLEIVKIFFKR